MAETAPNSEEQAECGEWVAFGTIIDLMMPDLERVWTFINALEAGKLRARRVGPPPPATGNPALDNADPSSTDFWRIYRELKLGISPAEMEWTGWLRSCVEVEQTPAFRIFANEAEPTSWSDIQALAWVASNDGNLVAKLANTEHSDAKTRRTLRAQALEYLRVHVAMKHCCCGAREPGQCTCLTTASDELAAGLRDERLRARALQQDRTGPLVLPADIRIAPFDRAAGTLNLAEGATEVRFDERGVRSAYERRSAPTTTEPPQQPRGAAETRPAAAKRECLRSIEEIVAKADEMKASGMSGYDIARSMQHEPGFGGVKVTLVRHLIKGRYKRGR